ncbi:MAG: hypothetical protein ACYC7I_08640 [Gammaproteobacteria bacterium]
MIKAYAAHESHGKLEPFEYDPGELADDQIEIDVIARGAIWLTRNVCGQRTVGGSPIRGQSPLLRLRITS